MSKQLPTHARVVIIGGGIVGCSVAYHLCKIGWQEVVLLERKTIASGTSWAAAGLLGQLWSDSALTKLAVYGAELYARLEAETGQPTGYQRPGSIRVAQTKARKSEFDRSMAMAHSFGIPMEEISLEEARRLFPLLNTRDLVAAWFQANDGHTNPEDTTQALAKGARMGGANLIEGIKVIDIHLKKGAVAGVRTDRGDIVCEYVVNCAGMWARQVGKMVGVGIPLHAAEHMHLSTNPIEGTYKGMPYLRDMDGYIYVKEEMGGLLMGGFEPVAKPWGAQGIPEDFAYTQLQEDWDQFEIFMKNAIKRVPAFEEAEVNSLTTVPESFTPDTAYMLGEAPGVKNFFVAAGMNSVGITSAGGAGKALAQWMDQGYPEEDLWAVDIRRFHGWQANHRYLYDRVTEAVGNLYADLSNEAFPFATAQEIDAAYARPLAIRISFVGELGWELYIPTEFSNNVFDTLMAAGEKHNLKLVGLHALDSLRLEKGYKHWGADITPDDTPFEAGLGFCVKMDKGDFIGRAALKKQLDTGIKRKLVTFTIEDPEPLIYHDEPVYRDGKPIGENTHGSFSHLLGCAIGMCYLENPAGIRDDWILSGRYEINVAGRLFPIKVHLKPPYDPQSARVRM